MVKKGFGAKKTNEEDPAHYSVLPSEGDASTTPQVQDDGKKRVWTKDGAIMVDNTEEYAYMKAQSQDEIIAPKHSSKVQAVEVKEEDERTQKLDDALDELALEDGTYDPYSSTNAGMMHLDEDSKL